ncbi:MAG: twin-arginine translocation signal domain-containing protein, partial [Proteobacteria bacterium]|nr:twin-arginine translocation signal domain-containing protein [Pseudomonadota bacterium]
MKRKNRKKQSEMNRRDFMKLAGIGGAALSTAGALSLTGGTKKAEAAALPAGLNEDEAAILSHLPDQQIGVKYPQGETITVGFLCALSGPSAGWGLPGLTGNNIWIDAVN